MVLQEEQEKPPVGLAVVARVMVVVVAAVAADTQVVMEVGLQVEAALTMLVQVKSTKAESTKDMVA